MRQPARGRGRARRWRARRQTERCPASPETSWKTTCEPRWPGRGASIRPSPAPYGPDPDSFCVSWREARNGQNSAKLRLITTAACRSGTSLAKRRRGAARSRAHGSGETSVGRRTVRAPRGDPAGAESWALLNCNWVGPRRGTRSQRSETATCARERAAPRSRPEASDAPLTTREPEWSRPRRTRGAECQPSFVRVSRTVDEPLLMSISMILPVKEKP